MSVVQWIVLVVAVAIVIGIYVYTRRDRRAMHRHRADGELNPLFPPRDQQLDIFAGGEFDEFGVGKPRVVSGTPEAAAEAETQQQASSAPSRTRKSGRQRVAPSIGKPRRDAPATPQIAESDTPVAQPRGAAQENVGRKKGKVMSLLLARPDGEPLSGRELHAALQEQELAYGARQIYHRTLGGTAVFSVASLVKPGHLDPAEVEHFTTPGLMLFMVLPGPSEPETGIRDMLATARGLAERLEGQIYDANRQPLTTGSSRALQQEVERWAAANHAT